MRPMEIPRTVSLRACLVCVIVAVGLSAAGCATTNGPKVVSMPNRQVVALDAMDVVEIMQCAGFNKDQIMDMGTRLRNDLAQSGAAQVEVNGRVKAIFAVRSGKIHITSRRGNFIYNPESQEFE